MKSKRAVDDDAPRASNVHHSHKTAEHGTPREVIAFAHYVFGGPPDLDPASSAYWNTIVGARQFFDKEHNALERPWRAHTVFENPPGTEEDEDDPAMRALPAKFWERTLYFRQIGAIDAIFWVGFSLQQLQVLQNRTTKDGAPIMDPLQFFTLFPEKRLDYLVRPTEEMPDPSGAIVLKHKRGCRGKDDGMCDRGCKYGEPAMISHELAGPPVKGGSPPHASYITFIPPPQPDIAHAMIRRFREGAQNLTMCPGRIVKPVQPLGAVPW